MLWWAFRCTLRMRGKRESPALQFGSFGHDSVTIRRQAHFVDTLWTRCGRMPFKGFRTDAAHATESQYEDDNHETST